MWLGNLLNIVTISVGISRVHYRIIMRLLKEYEIVERMLKLRILYNLLDKSFGSFLDHTKCFKKLQKKADQEEAIKSYYDGNTRAAPLRNLSNLLSF